MVILRNMGSPYRENLHALVRSCFADVADGACVVGHEVDDGRVPIHALGTISAASHSA